MLRFSHQIAASRVVKEIDGELKELFELDSTAVPVLSFTERKKLQRLPLQLNQVTVQWFGLYVLSVALLKKKPVFLLKNAHSVVAGVITTNENGDHDCVEYSNSSTTSSWVSSAAV
ncbi:hypothetical protein F2Q70_00007610 [Brassica cretica]|uniref:Uncharacterized protein n=1 Tax=Brassica cretica TaxID=69181 RepID=A0A8S9LP21_BRACR|nr:hypothetical protein F2Q70_00007610 [Brassica cretica]